MDMEKMTVFEFADKYEKDGTTFVLNDGKADGFLESNAGKGEIHGRN